MGLYHKYRPQEFDDMLGNKEVLQSLKDKLVDENRPHVYLFQGPSGCGKTTAARIFARRLGVDELALMEVNSANNRGIETARQIIEQMRSFPFQGKYWMWIIDEVHQTSKDFQNAMLKPLEDTPSHVYFFLCTTNPEKLIKPFRGRCTEVTFAALEAKYISLLLRRVAKAEEIPLSEALAEEIVDVSEGSPRVALVALEKVSKLPEDEALRLLRHAGSNLEVEDGRVLELCRAMMRKDGTWGNVNEALKSVYDDESDWEKIRYQVLGYANSILMKGRGEEMKRAALMVEFFGEPFYDVGKAGVTLACYRVMTLQ